MSQNPKTTIGLYRSLPAACRDYDPRSTEVAGQIGKMILAQLPSLTVEHIGSTAIPGCAGKGIIDLMILYPDGQLEAAKATLDALGFQRQTSRDPFPEDRPMRVGAMEYQGTTFQLHAHVIAASSSEASTLCAFRDQLRANPELRADYVVRKREIIAAGMTDSVDYCLAKGEFITQVVTSTIEDRNR